MTGTGIAIVDRGRLLRRPEHGAVQGAPGDAATTAPILPPMAAPTTPTWKQESKPEAAPEDEPEVPSPRAPSLKEAKSKPC